MEETTGRTIYSIDGQDGSRAPPTSSADTETRRPGLTIFVDGYGSETSATTRDSDEENVPPCKTLVSYEEFLKFCECDQRKSELFDEIKEKATGPPGLLRLLNLFNLLDTSRSTIPALCRSHRFIAQRIGRIKRDLAGASSVFWNPRNVRVHMYLEATKNALAYTRHHVEQDVSHTVNSVRNFEEARRQIFILIKEYNLEWLGEATFSKYGYI